MKLITKQDLEIAIRRLKQMRYFPVDAGMEGELMLELASMCHDAERLMWLSRRAIRLFPDWCGVGELRALYSSRWRPADGIRTFSGIFLATEGSDGYPVNDREGDNLSRLICPPRPMLQIEAPELPIGKVSADARLDRIARSTAAHLPTVQVRPEDYDNPANEALYYLERGVGIEDNDADRYRREVMSRVPQRKAPPPWPEGIKPITEADIEAIKKPGGVA
jgi:hypothetical protein